LEGFHRFFSGLGEEPVEALLGDVDKVGPGGHFLGTDHTRLNYFSINPLQNNDSYEQWLDEGAKSAETVGALEARRMLDAYIPPPMPGDARAALDDFVARRRAG
jgi:trimethylamine--corrinoid protein Co-methyltransferase